MTERLLNRYLRVKSGVRRQAPHKREHYQVGRRNKMRKHGINDWMVIWPLSVTDYRLDAPLMSGDHLNQPWSRYLSYIGLRKTFIRTGFSHAVHHYSF